MGKIVAISGGELADLETFKIDKEIVELTGKEHPNALFVPTASSDDVNYCKVFKDIYGDKLGCNVNILFLIKERMTTQQIRDKILSTDLIYVGGGNTLKMMRLWRRLGVDRILKAAYNNGIVLSGISAGSICWFKCGHSDSLRFYNPENWKYIMVTGMGLLRAINCIHYDGEMRDSRGQTRYTSFRSMMRARSYQEVGIAVENNCAIEFIDDRYRVLSSKKGSRAYRVSKSKGNLTTETIEEKSEYTPIETLFREK
jgi:dipeptidase E